MVGKHVAVFYLRFGGKRGEVGAGAMAGTKRQSGQTEDQGGAVGGVSGTLTAPVQQAGPAGNGSGPGHAGDSKRPRLYSEAAKAAGP